MEAISIRDFPRGWAVEREVVANVHAFGMGESAGEERHGECV